MYLLFKKLNPQEPKMISPSSQFQIKVMLAGTLMKTEYYGRELSSFKHP